MIYRKRTLPNGLRVITAPMKGTRAVTVLVLVRTGSKYESEEISGVSHFLEHMFFKGSKHFPSVRKITEALDRLGAEYNAFTDKEVTGFWVKIASDNIEQAVRIVGDMLRSPRFPKGEMERERGVVLEELNLYYDTPARFIGDLWEKVLHGNQPAGRYVGGTPESVKTISHDDIVRHFETYYKAPAMVVTLAGAVTSAQAFAIAQKYFRGIRRGETPDHPALKERQMKPKVLTHRKRTDQTHIALGFRGVSLTHPMHHPAAVLAAILGGTMSSRLFLLIRDRLGLAYHVQTLALSDTETGSLVTIAGLRNDKVKLAIDAILKEYRKMSRQAPSAQELRKAKEAVVGRFALGVEQTDELAVFVASQELLLEKIRTPDEEIRAVRRVTPKQVRDAAKLLFRPERLNLALIGRDAAKRQWYDQLIRAFPKQK